MNGSLDYPIGILEGELERREDLRLVGAGSCELNANRKKQLRDAIKLLQEGGNQE